MSADQRKYRGVVCEILEYRGQCEYAVLVMARNTVSTIESFEAGHYYGRKIPSTLDERGFTFGPHVIRLEHRMLLRAGNPFQIIGRVDLDKAKYCLGSFTGVLDIEDMFEDYRRTEKKPELAGFELLPLRELMRIR